MSKIKWSARINFYSADEKIKIVNIPVLSYQVRGGAIRTVHLNSAKDTDIVLELDDARDHKNIQIFIPPSEGIAIAQLGEAFIMKRKLLMDLLVDSKIGRTWIKAFNLYSEDALILRHPVAVQRNDERALKIEMSLPSPRLEEQSPRSENIRTIKAI